MKRMIFATGNENKMVEIREILGELPLEILSMKQAGITADIVEDGKTFEETLTPEGQAMLQARVDAKFDYQGGLQKQEKYVKLPRRW